ncbi:MAG: lytic transglycosylase domain-containing protein [Chitinophagaceae bacterium]|nr:lytic transglycosylase domain-containing protein [Chitinophagaceae bacterium]
MVKLFLAGVIGLLFSGIALAGKPEKDYYFQRNIAFSDTADKVDSLTQAPITVPDPKKEFLEFTFSSSMPFGINTEQLNPQVVSFVQAYIRQYGKKMEEIKGWGKPYFDMMDEILTLHSLPKELKYLAVIESYLRTNARSRVGAVGPWQFMPATAKNMGLRVTKKYDERKDFSKSTHAASKYLASLYELYGDWLLVIAAYNGGPGKVNAAIRKSGSRDFWALQKYLPAESQKHVKKFIATHYIMEGQGGITTVAKNDMKEASVSPAAVSGEASASKTQTISGRYNSFVIMKHISIDIASFNKLNPGFDKLIASSGSYELRLPHDKMDVFLAKKPVILDESIQMLLNGNNN